MRRGGRYEDRDCSGVEHGLWLRSCKGQRGRGGREEDHEAGGGSEREEGAEFARGQCARDAVFCRRNVAQSVRRSAVPRRENLRQRQRVTGSLRAAVAESSTRTLREPAGPNSFLARLAETVPCVSREWRT